MIKNFIEYNKVNIGDTYVLFLSFIDHKIVSYCMLETMGLYSFCAILTLLRLIIIIMQAPVGVLKVVNQLYVRIDISLK